MLITCINKSLFLVLLMFCFLQVTDVNLYLVKCTLLLYKLKFILLYLLKVFCIKKYERITLIFLLFELFLQIDSLNS